MLVPEVDYVGLQIPKSTGIGLDLLGVKEV